MMMMPDAHMNANWFLAPEYIHHVAYLSTLISLNISNTITPCTVIEQLEECCLSLCHGHMTHSRSSLVCYYICGPAAANN